MQSIGRSRSPTLQQLRASSDAHPLLSIYSLAFTPHFRNSREEGSGAYCSFVTRLFFFLFSSSFSLQRFFLFFFAVRAKAYSAESTHPQYASRFVFRRPASALSFFFFFCPAETCTPRSVLASSDSTYAVHGSVPRHSYKQDVNKRFLAL